MKPRYILFAWLAVAAFTGPAAAAPDHFDYENTQHLYAVTGSEAIAYAKFPVFLEFRELITAKMRVAEESGAVPSPAVYTLRVVGIGKETTLHVGESWIGNGDRIATLSGEEFAWVKEVIELRKGTGIDAMHLDGTVRLMLEAQNDPAWLPAP